MKSEYSAFSIRVLGRGVKVGVGCGVTVGVGVVAGIRESTWSELVTDGPAKLRVQALVIIPSSKSIRLNLITFFMNHLVSFNYPKLYCIK